MNQVFDAYAHYYDLVYQDKDYSGESTYIGSQIHKRLPQASSILELGCGTGAHAELLARLGFRVHGVDMSEKMLERAQQRKATLPAEIAQRLSFGPGDVRSVRTERSYDAVISLFHVISYQATNADLVKAFETAATHLNRGGLFLFDFWYGPAVLTQVPEKRIKHLEDKEIRVIRTAEPVMHVNENCVDVNYDISIEYKNTGNIKRIHEKHKMRYLFLPELELYLEPETWSNFKASEWLGDEQLSAGSWSAFVVATRK